MGRLFFFGWLVIFGWLAFPTRGESLVVACRGETGDELLKLDADTLGVIASCEQGFWGPIASLHALPDGNVAIVERTGRACPRPRRLQADEGIGSGAASLSLLDMNDFDGFNYRFAGATARYSGEPSVCVDGSLGGIANRFGEVLLTQNSSQNFDGAELFNGLDPALPRLYGQRGFEQTGSLNPAVCGVAGVALSNGDWVLAGYEPLEPNHLMATLERRSRTNIMDRGAGGIFRTGIEADPPAAIAINRNDQIALALKSGKLMQMSCRDSQFAVEITRKLPSPAGMVTALAATPEGNWVVGINGGGDGRSGRALVVEQQTLTTQADLSHLEPVTALAVKPDGDIVIGTAGGQIIVYDRELKTLKRQTDGFGPITQLVVVSTSTAAPTTRRVVQRQTPDGVAKHPAWINALKPPGQPAPQITLADNGKTNYAIICSADPTTQEKKAAADLEHWLREMTGASFPLLQESPGASAPPGEKPNGGYAILGIGNNVRIDVTPAHFISVGLTRLAQQAGLATPESELAAEGYRIAVEDQNLYLFGGTQRGPINAVYALLEEDLGCRWYTAAGATLPFSPTLRFAPVPRTYLPVLVDRRDPWYTEAQDGDWYLRNRALGIGAAIPAEWGGYPKPLGLTGYVHSLPTNIVPDSEFFDKHPEYYILTKDGQRSPAQLCLTNPNVLRIAIERIRKALAADPEARIVDVSPRDGGGICQCDACRAINEREKSGMGTLLTFVNAVADAVRNDYPDVRVTTLAYLDTILPPKTLRPRDNVLIWLCTDSHAWEHLLQFVWETEPEAKQRPGHVDVFDKALRGWHAIGAKMVIWDYPIDYHNCMLPLPNMPVVSENMRYYIKHGATGIYEQAQHNSITGVDRSLLRSWVWSKQMWDPSRDTRALIRDFNYGFYGKAAEPMQAYDDLMWQTWEDLHKDLRKLRQSEIKYGPGVGQAFLTPEFIGRSYKLMLEAERLAEGDPALVDRIKIAKLPTLFLMCQRGRERGQKLEDYLALVDEFEAIAKAHNVTSVVSCLRPPWRDEVIAQWREKAGQE